MHEQFPESSPIQSGGEISVGRILQMIGDSKFFIAAFIAAGLLAGVVATFVMPVTYTATALIGPPLTEQDSKSGALGQLGAIGSLVGIRGTNSSSPAYDLAQELLTSERLASALDQRYHLLDTISKRRWQRDSAGKWEFKQEPGVLFKMNRWLYGLFGLNSATSPTPYDLANFIKNEVRISSSASTTSADTTLIFRHVDKEFARDLLSDMITVTDDLIRDDARAKADAELKYLDHALDGVTSLDHRQALIALVSDTEKRLIAIGNGLPYAIRIIDGPTISPLPTSPKPLLNILIGGVLGLFVGAALATLRKFPKQSQILPTRHASAEKMHIQESAN